MSRRTGWTVAAILAAHAGLLLWTAARNSVTVDEFAHLPAGLAYWRAGAFFICNLSPPLLRLWAAVPLALTGVEAPAIEAVRAIAPLERHFYYADAFLRAHSGAYHHLFLLGRCSLIPLSCAGGWVVFRWARALYGDQAGLAACVLYAVCPNILAHASLVGTDAGTMVFMLAACWLWWQYCRQPGPGRWALAAAAIGLAHLCKFAALLLWPVWLAMALRQPPRRRLLLACAAAAAAALLIFNAGYGFQGTGRPLREYPQLRETLPWLRALPEGTPVLLPREFVDGVQPQARQAWRGRHPAYLLGVQYRGAYWLYYPVTLLCKLPMGTLALLLLALLSVWGRWGRQWSADEQPVVLAAAIIGMGIMAGAALNVGIRYLLPLLPLLFIFAGRMWAAGVWPAVSRGAWLLVLAAAMESVAAAPRYLSFMNLAFHNPSVAYQVVNDSSLDWGQSLLELKTWMRRQHLVRVELAYWGSVDSGVYGIPVTPVAPLDQAGRAEYVAVSAVYLTGVRVSHPEIIRRAGIAQIPFYRALQRRRPVAVLGSIYVFRREDWDAAAREHAAGGIE